MLKIKQTENNTIYEKIPKICPILKIFYIVVLYKKNYIY